MKYGYVRVSTQDQNEMRQIIALTEEGVRRENIYLDKKSGKNFERDAYQSMVLKLKRDDELLIKSIDRLGRNYEEILTQWRLLTKEKGVVIRVLDMPLLDTTNEKRDLTGILISDIVLQLLSYVAETEREFIRKRQAEGIAAAKKAGIHFGRKPLPLPENFPEIREKWRLGQITIKQAAVACGMAPSTFFQKAKKYKNHEKSER